MRITLFIPITILCFISCSTTTSTKNESTSKVIDKVDRKEIVSEPADSLEFVDFWKMFQKSLVEKDTSSLLLMVSDTLDINHPSLGFGYFTKSYFIEKIDILLSLPYFFILNQYDIEKNLYFITTIDSKRYSVSTYFDIDENWGLFSYKDVTFVFWGYQDLESSSSAKTVFGFVKTGNKIKMCCVGYYAMSVSAG